MSPTSYQAALLREIEVHLYLQWGITFFEGYVTNIVQHNPFCQQSKNNLNIIFTLLIF